MALSNLENRVKQDSAYPRTAEDAIRRDKDIDKVTIKASQIELEGYTTINGGFKIDKEGNMECINASITGSSLELNSTSDNPNIHITNKNSQYGSYPDLYLYGNGYKVKDNTSEDVYAELFTYGNRGYEIVPHSELYLGSTFNNRTIMLDGLLGDISTEGEVLSVNGVCQGSREEIKKNIEKFDNALDILKGTDIYKYNLKKEDNSEKKHIGFVIGDHYRYRREITDKKNENADLYSMISVLWKAVQEQQEEIEELKKKVNK